MNEGNAQQVKQIERDEAWLAGVMADYPEPAPSGLENIKLSVRIAAQQHILEVAATLPPSRDTLNRVKRAVRVELDLQAERELVVADRSVAHRWGGVRWSSVVGGLAAAAALAFWFVPANITPSSPAQTNVDTAIEDFLVVVTHGTADGESDSWPDLDEVTGEDEWSAQVAAFESELEEVSDLLVSDDSGWDDYRLNDLDAIDDEIDDLYQELEDALET